MAREPHNFDELLVPVDADERPLPREVGLAEPRFFPMPTATSPDGLLCVGGRLSPEWLLDAYRHGIFPWPMWEDEPVAWWSPDPRAIIELDALHVSRRLQRTLRGVKFTVTFDQDFAGVIQSCATAGDRRGNTWLTPAMIDAYCQMHALGHAHSVEVWSTFSCPLGERRMQLAGGAYGIAIGGLFAAESMFHRVRDASKIAIVHLVERLRSQNFQLLDIQQWTPHTGRLGAVEIPRLEYLRRLAMAVELSVNFSP